MRLLLNNKNIKNCVTNSRFYCIMKSDGSQRKLQK
nr:MAG TPA: hypothetical protein [Caudoviricetes sp.]